MKINSCDKQLISSMYVFTFDKCPLKVLRVLIWMRPIASMLTVACDRFVSHAAFLPSLMEFFRCSASCRSCSSSFILVRFIFSGYPYDGCSKDQNRKAWLSSLLMWPGWPALTRHSNPPPLLILFICYLTNLANPPIIVSLDMTPHLEKLLK